MSKAPEIQKDEVSKLALLARIDLSSEEEQELTADLQEILGYVQEVQSLDGDVAEMGHGTDEVNVFREDEITNEPGAYTERILAEAPGREGDLVKVKKILG